MLASIAMDAKKCRTEELCRGTEAISAWGQLLKLWMLVSLPCVARQWHGVAACSQFCFHKKCAEEWNQQDGRFFWPSCGKFVFRGTRTHLQNSYFIVSVLTGKPPAFLANNSMLGGKWFRIGLNLETALTFPA